MEEDDEDGLVEMGQRQIEAVDLAEHAPAKKLERRLAINALVDQHTLGFRSLPS